MAGLRRSGFGALVMGIAVILAAGPVLAVSWSPVQQLSSDAGNAVPLDRGLAVAGGSAHVVYSRAGVRYQRSTNLGSSWLGERLLAADTTGTVYSAWGVAAYGRSVAVLFRSRTDSTKDNGLYIRRSLDGGVTWEPRQRLAGYTGDVRMGFGAVAVTATSILVAWTDRTTGKVYLRRSLDDGVTFLPRQALGATTHSPLPNILDGYVGLAASGSRVHVAWTPKSSASGSDHGGPLVLVRSSDGGAAFGSPQTIESRDTWEIPALSAYGSTLLVSYQLVDGKVVVARSADSGASFARTTVATPGDTYKYGPGDVALGAGGLARVVYTRKSKMDDRVMMRTSNDGGATWSTASTAMGGVPTAKASPNVAVTATWTLLAFGTSTVTEDLLAVYARRGAN